MFARPIRLVAVAATALLALTACAQGSATKPAETAASGSSAPVSVTYMNFGANGGHEQDRIWALVALEVWHESFFAETPGVPRPRGAVPGAVAGSVRLSS